MNDFVNDVSSLAKCNEHCLQMWRSSSTAASDRTDKFEDKKAIM